MDVSLFRVDALSGFVSIFVGLFGILTIIYSIGFMKGRGRLFQYYAYIVLTTVISIGAVLSNNLILFITLWGILAITLFLLINFGERNAQEAAKKSLIIVGGSDAVMLIGIAIIWKLTHTFQMDAISISLNSTPAILAFVTLAIGAFAKAGAMPVHTWIPSSAEVAPLPVMAFLPASLDKLLGIYFLGRLSLDLFVLKMGSSMSIFLLIIGAVTIIAAVMMALIQHNLKKLLSYHAVSQVGYMVLGIGTANPIGIAGGLFHMLNHAIYKSCLFLCGGSVEHRARTSDLYKLGGLAHFMPITFVTCLIASLSISGVPPFNGFVSKWMVYQGIIELGKSGDKLWIIWLVAAMFGSALTLASFMKLIHATFLGQRSEEISNKPVSEVGFTMWLPMVILAGFCVIFGVFAYKIPLKLFIGPSVGGAIPFSGTWSSSLATGLILMGIAIGFIIYLIGNIKGVREDEPFVGGADVAKYKEMRVSGVEFYETIKSMPFLKWIYKKAEDKFFDIYDQGSRLTLFFTKMLKKIHNGILPSYLGWCLLGMIILIYILFKVG